MEISSFYTSVPKIMIICYIVPEIWCVIDVIVIFHFGLFFANLPPSSPKNLNFKKLKKVHGNIIILHTCTKNYDQVMYGSWDMVCDGQMDGRTDWRKKWHIEVGAPPKKHKITYWMGKPFPITLMQNQGLNWVILNYARKNLNDESVKCFNCITYVVTRQPRFISRDGNNLKKPRFVCSLCCRFVNSRT